VYLDADGTVVNELPGIETYIPASSDTLEAALGELNGFGLTSGVLFRIDRAGDPSSAEPAAVDVASLPASGADCLSSGSSVLFVDLDAGAGESALVPCRAGYQDDRANGSLSSPVLAVLPARGSVLSEGRRYAAVLTTSLTVDGGKAVGPSASFAAIRDGDRAGPWGALYGDAIDAVLARVPGLERSAVVAVSPITTQRVTHELAELRALVGSLPAPVLRWDAATVAPMSPAVFTKDPAAGSTATLADWLGTPATLPGGGHDPAADQTTGLAYDALLAVATGVFEAPNFLRERESYADPVHRTFARGAAGEIIQSPDAPTAKIWITIAIPDRPMPPGGFPVVAVQHGLQGDRAFLLTMANAFAKQGWASVAIEALTFGARSSQPNFKTDETVRFPWSRQGGYAGPDGFVDVQANAFALFGEMVSFSATRDQFRQSVVDYGTLANLLADPALDLGPLEAVMPGLMLDGDKLVYVGDSFGSVLGALVAAVDPRFRAMVLNVGGGGILVELASNAPLLSSLLGPLAGLTFGLTRDRLNWRHPLVNLVQPVIDGADPLAYADALAREPVIVESTGAPKSVVIIEALWDELVANEGSEALAFAAGIPLAEPSTGPMTELALARAEPSGGLVRGVPGPGHTVVLLQASPATHGSDLYSARGLRRYAAPFVTDDGPSFAPLPMPIEIDEPYLELQAMMVGFFGTAFAGEIPAVGSFPAPVRDFDGDGRPDDADGAPLDPSQ
jgi:hypothetical protein